MNVLKRLAACALALCAIAATPAQADRSIVVLDASGSMWAQIDGTARIEIARQTLRKVLAELPADLDLGLMVYGHREKGSCDDIQLMVRPGKGNGKAIQTVVDAINPKGKTPLSEAVKRAAEELRYTEEKATVILVTDGLETCNADPCALATELERAGVDFTAHVVGFGLTAEEGRQVACLAENTGGQYFEAQDGDALTDALTRTVVQAEPAPAPTPPPAPPPAPAAAEFNFLPKAILAEGLPPLPDDAGNPWVVHKAKADGSQGDYVSTEYGNSWKASLAPGSYIVTASYGEATLSQTIAIEAGKIYEPVFTLNAGTLKVRPLAVAGGDPVDAAAVYIVHPQGETTSYGPVTFYLPAGEQKLTVTIGSGKVVETFALKAGEVMERDVVVGVGRAVINAAYVEGMKVEDGGLSVKIAKAAKKIDGSREEVTYAFGPDSGHDLPAGDYVVIASMHAASAEAPFSVKVGERVDVNVVLNAGVAAIAAPGARKLEIVSATKDIQGKRKSFAYSFDQNFQTTLPAGTYVVLVERDGATKESEFTVKGGERTELSVQ